MDVYKYTYVYLLYMYVYLLCLFSHLSMTILLTDGNGVMEKHHDSTIVFIVSYCHKNISGGHKMKLDKKCWAHIPRCPPSHMNPYGLRPSSVYLFTSYDINTVIHLYVAVL